MCTMRHSPTGGPMKANDVKTVGVIGAGIMGSGIVEVFAKSGLDVTFVEVDVAARDRGLAAIERSMAKAVERGKLEESARDEALSRVTGVTDIGELGGADFVIEVVTEDLP